MIATFTVSTTTARDNTTVVLHLLGLALDQFCQNGRHTPPRNSLGLIPGSYYQTTMQTRDLSVSVCVMIPTFVLSS